MSTEQETGAAGQDPHTHGPKRTPIQGLFTLAGAVVVVGLYMFLASVLKIGETWVGYLFALYWAGLERGNFRRLPHSLLGAGVGLTVAYLMHLLPETLGARALAPCLAIILVMVYFQIMGWLPVAINMVAMLFLTVATIPSIPAGVLYPKLMVSLAAGAAYFMAVIWIARQISRRGERSRTIRQQA